ncbi:MAG: cupin domain-containing protein [Bacteroidetes bacterium]|nr:cupin domain-containing protein [Bacteroidota bacterium]MBS1973771.1 cupin domain-containing protein [Bacteroidota bacterium]
MRKEYSIVSCIVFLLIYSNATFSQDNLPPVKNIFKTIKSDTSNSLWTFKKTGLLRINVVKMKGTGKLHKHPDADHTILVIKGVILAEINGKKMILRKGDMISIPAGIPHKYIVKGSEAIIVSMDAPYYDPSKTIILE